MPRLLTRGERRRRNRLKGGRLHLGTLAGIKSERWPTSTRNRWPACVGICSLVVDNLKVHHAHKVKAWLQSHRHAIELFYLPAYAPDHNPDEYLNHDLKQKLRQKPQPASKPELAASTRIVMRAIQRSAGRIRGYFTPAPVRYAA